MTGMSLLGGSGLLQSRQEFRCQTLLNCWMFQSTLPARGATRPHQGRGIPHCSPELASSTFQDFAPPTEAQNVISTRYSRSRPVARPGGCTRLVSWRMWSDRPGRDWPDSASLHVIRKPSVGCDVLMLMLDVCLGTGHKGYYD